VRRPTAFDNPVTYEGPLVPGERPPHPVCNDGVVALDRKRAFPELAYKATSLVMGKRPEEHNTYLNMSSGGGSWVPTEAQDVAGLGEMDCIRISDARRKKFPEMTYTDTLHLTTWHWGKGDLDHLPQPKQVRVADPSTIPEAVKWSVPEAAVPYAGKPQGVLWQK